VSARPTDPFVWFGYAQVKLTPVRQAVLLHFHAP
jgi:hypothetical protein